MELDEEKQKQELERWLADLATQYYVAGRLACQAGLTPVLGNLLHHAVELYLKSALISTLNVKDLDKQLKALGHDLKRLWAEFRKKHGDADLGRFDSAIEKLHDFERIRYPNNILSEGMAMSLEWAPTHASTIAAPSGTVRNYQVTLADVDELVINVLNCAGINPKFLAPIAHGVGHVALRDRNAMADRWF